MSSETFDSSNSWVCPAGVTSVDAECWGGGGGGGRDEFGMGGGGAGGGGGYSKKLAVAVTPGNSYTATVGVGGSPNGTGLDGVAGGDSWFSTSGTVLAKGGGRGRGSDNGSIGGSGGALASGVGDTKYSGGNGGSGSSPGRGGGGGSSAGTGANGANGGNGGGPGSPAPAGGTAPTGGGNGGAGSIPDQDGGAGVSPGGGGGGGGRKDGLVNKFGGAGAAGRVVLTYEAAPSPSSAAGGKLRIGSGIRV